MKGCVSEAGKSPPRQNEAFGQILFFNQKNVI